MLGCQTQTQREPGRTPCIDNSSVRFFVADRYSSVRWQVFMAVVRTKLLQTAPRLSRYPQTRPPLGIFPDPSIPTPTVPSRPVPSSPSFSFRSQVAALAVKCTPGIVRYPLFMNIVLVVWYVTTATAASGSIAAFSTVVAFDGTSYPAADCRVRAPLSILEAK